MLTHGEDVEAHALRERGWTIAAIARHLGRDRKTVRGYLDGTRPPGVRARSSPDPLAPFVEYLRARFVDDPHVWASALFDEVWGWHGLADIHLKARGAGKDVQHGDHGAEQAP